MEAIRHYFSRRAQQERASVEGAASPAVRHAHLELAFRYEKAADEICLARPQGDDPTLPRPDLTASMQPQDLQPALDSAFPVPRSGTFEHLLDAIGQD